MSDWLALEVQRYERRVRLRRAYQNAMMWFWPAVSIALTAYIYYRGLF